MGNTFIVLGTKGVTALSRGYRSPVGFSALVTSWRAKSMERPNAEVHSLYRQWMMR